VLGVLVVADDRTDVVQQPRVLQQAPHLVVEPVLAAERVEEPQRQRRHVARVRLVAAKTSQEAQDAAQLQVLDRVEALDLLGVADDVIGQQPLAHAEVRHRQHVEVERAQRLHEDDRARDQDLRARRVEAGQAQPLGQ
jgi:hypothetical protein